MTASHGSSRRAGASHYFLGMIVDVDELAVPAADGVPLHVSCTGEGADVVVLSGGPGCVHYLADEGLHLPVCGHGFRNRAALAALAGDLTTWRELWRI